MKVQDSLLSQLKKGEEQAYKSLFYNYFSDLVYYANSILKDREASEDLIQEIFVSFWQEKKYNNIRSGLEGYLYSTVRNSCLNYLRDEKRKNRRLVRMLTEQAEDTKSLNEESDNLKIQDELFRIIHHLPDQCKKIFTMCALEGIKYQETADILGISINTVRTQMGRAYKLLRDNLSEKTFTMLLFYILSKQLNYSKV